MIKENLVEFMKWKYLLIISSIFFIVICSWVLLFSEFKTTNLIYAIYIVSLFLVIYLIWDYKKVKKNIELERKHSLVQVISVIIAIALALHSLVISIDALKSSDVATNKTIEILDKISKSSKNLSETQIEVSDRLKKIPDQLDKFSKSIDSLNNIVNAQQKTLSSNINMLNESSDSLKSNLTYYGNSLGRFDTELKTVTSATDKQLKIWATQQELMKKEFDRKPIINLKYENCSSTDSTFTIDGVAISNDGNIECNILRIFMIIDKRNLVKVDFPEAKERNEQQLFKDKKMYELFFKGSSYGDMIVMDGTGTYVPLKVFYQSKGRLNKPNILFRIDCLSKYKNAIYNFHFLGCDKY